GQFLTYTNMKTRYRFDLTSGEREELGAAEDTPAPPRRRSRRSRGGGGGLTGTYVGRPSRGRQYTQVDSPNDRWEALYENWNVVLKEKETGEKIAVTITGNEDIHYGTASWVYGEELGQNRAMWWTPDSQKLLFYKFDDTGVNPFHLVTGWSKFNTVHYPEYYPKAGAKNPGAELLVYDLATQKITPIDVGGGSEEYIYNIRTSPDGAVMLVNWTDRLQQHLKVMAIDLETGSCRLVIDEQQPTWQTNSPAMRYLADHERFIWTSESSGFSHYQLRHLNGELIHQLSSGDFQATGIEFVDEETSQMGFRGFSSPVNPYYMQYHIVGLDGSNQRRVTTLDFHHSGFQLSPDKKWLVAQYEEVNTPPSTALYSTEGKLIAKLAESDPAAAANIAEMFSFRSSDDQHDIYGILYKPKDFDPTQQYAIINSLYGGPGSNEISARYAPNPRSENNRGYLVVKVNNRGTGNRGKAFLGAAYLRLGDIDIQDHADAIRMLRNRPYVDGSRVGIVGFSYGGYMSAMGILKHPDVYTAAVNGSGVTDWRHYDTIYTERYMSTPQLNPDGYDIGRATREDYVKNFKDAGGHLLIMHGMVDDNVHPNNAFQLIDALDKGGAPYESRFFPNNGHGLGRGAGSTQWEFFDRVLQPQFRGRRISL
ncbi:MAG: prolyl oligopeptidase family serine peptidase, partial [Planctomycetes bacterium]|nr:prolyl oligopeptidase family serine peptidase [Planctomycetota bacterium]